MSRSGAFSILLVLASSAPVQIHGATIHVPGDQPTIQAGLDAATAGDVVLVAPGVYADFQVRSPEGFPRAAIAFLKDGVKVQSEGGSGSTIIDVSAVKGPLATGAVGHSLPVGPNLLEGFTFRGDSTPGVGVVLSQCADARVNDCVFEDLLSESASGAGAYLVGSAVLENCTFLRCSAPSFGALYHEQGDLVLTHCTFRECDDGAVGCYGTPSAPCSQTVSNCDFLDNIGGGIAIDEACAIVRECEFQRNLATYYGRGAVAIMGGTATIEKCVFIDNGSTVWIGSVLNCVDECTVRSNTFARNFGVQSDWSHMAIIALSASGSTFDHNIVWGTYYSLVLWTDPSLSRDCNVYHMNWGLGVPLVPRDRIVDPAFCDPKEDDFTLRSGSPCLPDDPLGCGLIGRFGLGCGAVSIRSTSWGAIKGAYR